MDVNLHEIWCTLMNKIMLLEVQHLRECRSLRLRNSCSQLMQGSETEKVAVAEPSELMFATHADAELMFATHADAELMFETHADADAEFAR